MTVEGQKYRNEVSSPKYTAELVDMPQTVVVIPKTVFREQAAITLSDVLRNTPGITLLAGEGGGASNTAGDSFFMRGFDATNSIFIDGVRDQAAYSRDVFNLDQVEVSKGPSGSYTGRGNASGSVNLVTKTPNDQPLRLMGVTYGTNDHVRGTVDFNQPLSETFLGGTAVRLNAMWQDGGVAGRDEVERDAWGIAPSLAIGLGADTRLALAAQILRQESTPDYGLPSAALPGLASHDAAGRSRRPEQLLRHRRRRLRRHRLRQLHGAHRARLRARRDAAQSLALQRQPPHGRGHDDPESRRLRSGHRARHARAADQRAHQSQLHEPDEPELRVPDRRPGALDEHRRRVRDRNADQSRDARARARRRRPTSIIRIRAIRSPTSPRRAPARSRAARPTTVAAYGFDTIELSRQWQLSAGARVERYDTDFLSVAIPGSGTADIKLGVSDTLTSWNGGLVFKPADNGSIYCLGSDDADAAGRPEFHAVADDDRTRTIPALEPQKSTNYELGTKWDLLEGRLSTTAAVFHTVNTNVVTSETIGGTVVAVSFDSEQQVDGIELSVSGLITPKWQVFAGYAYLDSEFKKSVTPNQQDATLQWTPRNSGNLWTTYQLPLGFSIGGGVRYMDTVARSSLTMPNGAGADSRLTTGSTARRPRGRRTRR